MIQQKIRLGDLLVELGHITEEQVGEALRIQKESDGMKRMGQVLIEQGFITEEEMLKALANQLKVKYLEPGSFEVELRVVEKLQLGALKKNLALPFKETEDAYVVAFADPLDYAAQDTIQRLLPQKPIEIVVTRQKEIERHLDRLESAEGLKNILADVRREVGQGGSAFKEEGEDSAIKQLIDVIVKEAIRKKASDIHIEPLENECHIRGRIDGFLQELYILDGDIYPPLASRVKLLGQLDIAERRKPQDGRFSLEVDGKEYDFRLSSLPVQGGESMVMRILDKSKVLIQLDKIGFDEHNVQKYRRAMEAPYGIIFITGPTGSGKTTSLYAGLNEIKNISKKIITVEDPVEYKMSLIQQVQVNNKAGLTFAGALRSILRQDPDVIMVGESRDLETLSIAIQAALTGHLVFTTLHTNDAISAINRVLDMGVEPFLVANAVVAIQAQRLVRTICPYCKKPVTIPDEVLERIREHLPESYRFYQGEGCKRCNMAGYQGRTIISEVLEVSEAVAGLIARGATKQQIQEKALEEGFETMFTIGVRKAAAGETTLDEVMRVAKL